MRSHANQQPGKPRKSINICTECRYGCGESPGNSHVEVLKQRDRTTVLVEFHQHPADLDIVDHDTSGRSFRHPRSVALVRIDTAHAARSMPPATTKKRCAVLNGVHVVVAVLCAEWHSVGDPIPWSCGRERISGVSAVPVHRQLVVTSLITDGERRVFSPVPQTVSTMDLLTAIIAVLPSSQG